jgi:deoxyribonuclease-4
MITGAHESVAGGLHTSLERATKDGCAALQIFTKNGNQWREPDLGDDKIAAFKAAHVAAGSFPILAHTSYLINLGTDDEELLKRSKDALVAEVLRCSALGIPFAVLHPGAHNGAGETTGIDRVVECLSEVLERTEGASARVLIENTAGQGTCLGCTFEQIAGIFEGVGEDLVERRMGVCFDTQHAFASGYDISTDKGYEDTVRKFDKTVGLGHLRAFHLNDSKKPLASRVDRHEHIGEGNLGLPTFWRLANDARFATTPGVLETEPREGDFPYKAEVALVRGLKGVPCPEPAPPSFSLALSSAPKKASKTSKSGGPGGRNGRSAR